MSEMSDNVPVVIPGETGVWERWVPQALWPATEGSSQRWCATSTQACTTYGAAEASVRLHRESWDRTAAEFEAGSREAKEFEKRRPLKYRILKYAVNAELCE